MILDSNNQGVLPLFYTWRRVTPRDANLLQLANSTPSAHDRLYRVFYGNSFYPWKRSFLARYGVPSGQDLQILDIPCNRCIKGIWHSTYSDRTDICWHCYGKGIYRTDYNELTRYSIAGKIFHVPSTRLDSVQAEARITSGYYSHVFTKKINHTEVSEVMARKAFIMLLAKYDRPYLTKYLHGILATRWHKFWNFCGVRPTGLQRIAWCLRGLYRNACFGRDTLPF